MVRVACACAAVRQFAWWVCGASSMRTCAGLVCPCARRIAAACACARLLLLRTTVRSWKSMKKKIHTCAPCDMRRAAWRIALSPSANRTCQRCAQSSTPLQQRHDPTMAILPDRRSIPPYKDRAWKTASAVPCLPGLSPQASGAKKGHARWLGPPAQRPRLLSAQGQPQLLIPCELHGGTFTLQEYLCEFLLKLFRHV